MKPKYKISRIGRQWYCWLGPTAVCWGRSIPDLTAHGRFKGAWE